MGSGSCSAAVLPATLRGRSTSKTEGQPLRSLRSFIGVTQRTLDFVRWQGSSLPALLCCRCSAVRHPWQHTPTCSKKLLTRRPSRRASNGISARSSLSAACWMSSALLTYRSSVSARVRTCGQATHTPGDHSINSQATAPWPPLLTGCCNDSSSPIASHQGRHTTSWLLPLGLITAPNAQHISTGNFYPMASTKCPRPEPHLE
jgi:hypothetical protein